jgi:signal transduction histidine kinase
MRRRNWSFISGLTVILLLLLVLSGYCVMATRMLTADLDGLISHNYDAIRAIRELRDSTTRINAHYRKAVTAADIPYAISAFQHERELIESRVAQLARIAAEKEWTPTEREKSALLAALTKDYLDAYGDYFALRGSDREGFAALASSIAQLSGDITEAGGAVIELNEARIFARRDAAVTRGRQGTIIALAVAGISLLVYIYTSWRMSESVYRPLRELRDAIVRVGRRQFDEPVPVQGGEELGQIAETFNTMATRLRAYLTETDEKAVRAARDCRAILSALPYPVYIVDDEFAVRLSNPRGDALAASLGVPGALPSAVRRQIDEAAARGADVVDDDMHRVITLAPVNSSDSEKMPGAAYLPQVFRLGDEFAGRGWAVLLIDVTRLRRLDEAKTRALSTLGHEVKTPITGIRMSLLLLLEEKLGPLNADQRELLAAGSDDCERLLSVLQALLELARLESGRFRLELEPTTSEMVLVQAEAMHGEIVRQGGLALEVAPIPADAPPVLADAMHAGRVLGNFLVNAAKYAAPSTCVTMRAEPRADGYVRFTVANATARPLAEAEQARVFDPFYRRAGEQVDGAGLGLAIAREIAVAHGGRVGVWGEGERVEFYLDLRKAPAG